ncbi:MAG: hypothetical protein Q8S13_14320, partial [Dehalococcoidia bacterium]|nr:hypothetical protein [Dehalococcoidia bacterium]
MITPQSTSELATADLLASANAIIKQQMEHQKQILSVCTETGFQMLQLLSDNVKAQRDRIKELEEEVSVGKKMVDKAETLEHERTLKLAEFNRETETKERVMQMLETNVPSVLAMIGAKVVPGSVAAADASSRAIVSIVGSLSPEQMAQIAPMLTREQQMAIAGVRHAL